MFTVPLGMGIYFYLSTKKGTPQGPCVDIVTVSHEVLDKNTSVILVAGSGKRFLIRCTVRLCDEWVRDHAVAGLESNLRLEGVRIDASEHLEGYIWAVEETCVIW